MRWVEDCCKHAGHAESSASQWCEPFQCADAFLTLPTRPQVNKLQRAVQRKQCSGEASSSAGAASDASPAGMSGARLHSRSGGGATAASAPEPEKVHR